MQPSSIMREDVFSEDLEYEQAAQKTLDMFAPIQNAELDFDAIQKKYVCSEDECGKLFFDQGNYYNQSIKQLSKSATLLPNAFSDSDDFLGSYRKHQMTHGERMYICHVSTCGKKFLDNSKLKRH